MTKSIYDLTKEAKEKHKTTKNTYDMFPVGTKVKIITLGQDFNFFYGETGMIIKNTGTYLGLMVEYDMPRYFIDGHVERKWNFNPDDLIILKKPNKIKTVEKFTSGKAGWEIEREGLKLGVKNLYSFWETHYSWSVDVDCEIDLDTGEVVMSNPRMVRRGDAKTS
jgi:hypothetical protein